MPASTRFSAPVVRALDQSKIIGIRAGSAHRFIGIWAVVTGGRVFVRSWDRKPTGWYHAFRRERTGSVQIGAREIKVRAIPTRSERVKAAVDQAYRAKYKTPGALKWVRGFARSPRRDATLELVRAP